MSDNAAIDPVATRQRIRGVLAPVVTPFKVVPNVNASRNPAAREAKRPMLIISSNFKRKTTRESKKDEGGSKK